MKTNSYLDLLDDGMDVVFYALLLITIPLWVGISLPVVILGLLKRGFKRIMK